jgi:AbrB family looped-hinge helix DNA binding protein
MSASKPSVVNHKGMVTIPADIRERFGIHEGTKVTIMELDGNVVLIPIVDIQQFRTHTYEELSKIEDEARTIDLELEK